MGEKPQSALEKFLSIFADIHGGECATTLLLAGYYLRNSPVDAMHSRGSSKVSIRKGERERGSRKAVRTATRVSYRANRALPCGISGDPALSVTTK